MGEVAQRVGEGEGSAQERLPFAQRQTGHVAALQVEQVEQVVEDVHAGPPCPHRIAQLHPLLQAREAGLRPLERDRLAVDDEVLAGLPEQRLDQLGVGVVELLPCPRQQSHVRAIAEREAALAVELALEDPLLA